MPRGDVAALQHLIACGHARAAAGRRRAYRPTIVPSPVAAGGEVLVRVHPRRGLRDRPAADQGLHGLPRRARPRVRRRRRVRPVRRAGGWSARSTAPAGAARRAAPACATHCPQPHGARHPQPRRRLRRSPSPCRSATCTASPTRSRTMSRCSPSRWRRPFRFRRRCRSAADDRIVVLGDGRLGNLCAQVLAGLSDHVLVVGKHAREAGAARRIRASRPRCCRIAAFHRAPPISSSTAPGRRAACRRRSTLVRPRGTIVLKTTVAGAQTLAWAPFVIDEVTLVGSRCGPFDQALAALRPTAGGRAPLISERFDLSEGLDALERAQTQRRAEGAARRELTARAPPPLSRVLDGVRRGMCRRTPLAQPGRALPPHDGIGAAPDGLDQPTKLVALDAVRSRVRRVRSPRRDDERVEEDSDVVSASTPRPAGHRSPSAPRCARCCRRRGRSASGPTASST